MCNHICNCNLFDRITLWTWAIIWHFSTEAYWHELLESSNTQWFIIGTKLCNYYRKDKSFKRIGGKKLWVKNAVVFQFYANKICMYVPKNFTFLPIIDHCECIALGTHDYWSRRDALISDRPVNINIAVKFCSDDSSNKNKKKHYNSINT